MTFDLCRAYTVVLVMLNNVVRRWLHLLDMDVVCGRRKKKRPCQVAACLDVSAKSFRHKGFNWRWMKQTLILQPGYDVVDCIMLTRGRQSVVVGQCVIDVIKSIKKSIIMCMPPNISTFFARWLLPSSFYVPLNNMPCGWRGDFNNSEKMLLESSSESCRQRWR